MFFNEQYNVLADKRRPRTGAPNNINNFLFTNKFLLLNKLEQVALHGSTKPTITEMPSTKEGVRLIGLLYLRLFNFKGKHFYLPYNFSKVFLFQKCHLVILNKVVYSQ